MHEFITRLAEPTFGFASAYFRSIQIASSCARNTCGTMTSLCEACGRSISELVNVKSLHIYSSVYIQAVKTKIAPFDSVFQYKSF